MYSNIKMASVKRYSFVCTWVTTTMANIANVCWICHVGRKGTLLRMGECYMYMSESCIVSF